MVSEERPWFGRGGHHKDASSGGVFHFYYSYGIDLNDNLSFRLDCDYKRKRLFCRVYSMKK